MHAMLELHKPKTEFLDGALNGSRKEFAIMKGVVKNQRARLDATGARIVKRKNRRDEASASTATCCEKILRLQKKLAMALENVKVRSVPVVAITKERDAMPAKYEEPGFSVEQRVGFDNKKMVRFETKIVKMTQEWDASAAKTEQLLLEV